MKENFSSHSKISIDCREMGAWGQLLEHPPARWGMKGSGQEVRDSGPLLSLRPELSPIGNSIHGFQNLEVHSALSYKPGAQCLWRRLGLTIWKGGARNLPRDLRS